MARVLIALVMAFAFLGCSKPPEVEVWELKKGTTAADIGWKPAGPEDISFSREGDFDFTLIEHGADRTLTFHQRCWAIGASRNGEYSLAHDNGIDSVHAHFAKDITVDEAVPLARKVLEEWDGGLREPPAAGELSLNQFHESVKAGTFYLEQFGVQGRESGVVRFSFRGRSRGRTGGNGGAR